MYDVSFTNFLYGKTAKYKLVEDHETRSKDGQRKTTKDGEVQRKTPEDSQQLQFLATRYIFFG